ncbi:hypothetical protein Cgig2_021918 [Carnegiea gigantea]|uniref:Uncharacterized protein n=1 Tax=Carnegiea gigantea TaxID=171969 RepID=A0A9Q1GUG5_9CARY|nr:hypothetical protein Cgig2_021918 [Carnegiea gigantea]
MLLLTYMLDRGWQHMDDDGGRDEMHNVDVAHDAQEVVPPATTTPTPGEVSIPSLTQVGEREAIDDAVLHTDASVAPAAKTITPPPGERREPRLPQECVMELVREIDVAAASTVAGTVEPISGEEQATALDIDTHEGYAAPHVSHLQLRVNGGEGVHDVVGATSVAPTGDDMPRTSSVGDGGDASDTQDADATLSVILAALAMHDTAEFADAT